VCFLQLGGYNGRPQTAKIHRHPKRKKKEMRTWSTLLFFVCKDGVAYVAVIVCVCVCTLLFRCACLDKQTLLDAR
jgi:hypothetical protein